MNILRSLFCVLTFSLLALAPLATAGATAVAQATPQRPRCGTSLQFETRIIPGPSGKSARVAAICDTAPKMWGRTLQTAHFALHYTLGKNIHQPTLTPADAALKTLRDSLHTVFAALSPSRRDSAVNARLDSLGASHPAYIQHAAAYFENAYSYYADTLGMRMPDSNIADFFQGSARGKFNVDFGDIRQLQSYEGTYGLTFVPSSCNGLHSATMLIENDFVYGGSVSSSTGLVAGGSPIRVYAHNTLLHDYGVEWDAGLAVTIAHEFYHAVQFQYTRTIPNGGFHSWYELSAVAMEERLADTVNDYLGYLPTLLGASRPISIFSTGYTEDPNLNYANGIFHIFLSHTLGKSFDVAVWQRLATNGNVLPSALLYAVAGSQARLDSLYSAYAASLAIAGLPGSAASPLAFSPDFDRWDRPRMDSANAGGTTSIQLRPLSSSLVKPLTSAPTWAAFKGIPGATLVSQNGAHFSSTFVRQNTLPLIANGTLALAVANGSLDTTRTLTLSKGSEVATPLTAFPNPAPRSANGIHFAAFASGSTSPMIVVSESGRRVATLNADSTGSLWNWSFRDTQNRPLPAGVYYFGRSGDTPQTLLVLP